MLLLLWRRNYSRALAECEIAKRGLAERGPSLFCHRRPSSDVRASGESHAKLENAATLDPKKHGRFP